MNNKKAQIAIIAIFLAFTFVLSCLFFALPKKEYSSSEKRYLAKTPEFSLENFFSGKLTTSLEGGEQVGYIADHFPLRSLFVGINAYWNLGIGATASNGYYFCRDGYIITKPSDTNRADRNLQLINLFAASFDEVSLMVVPSAGEVLAEKLPKVHAVYPDKEVYDYIFENKADNLDFIDLREKFEGYAEKGEQIFYRTDHHWTSLGAYTAYKLYCNEKGIEAKDADEFEKTEHPGFYGTTYSSSGYFLAKPDTLEIWENKEIADKVKVTINEGTRSDEYTSMYFESHLSEDDMYPVFLDGNHALVTIENENAKSDETLLIIKDSFAHCAAPFLAENYSKVIMVDLRYYKNSVSDLVRAEGADEILFLYGMNNFCTDSNFAFLQ